MTETMVTTDKVRLSYVHLFKPYAASADQEAKFSVTILLPKSDVATKARIDAAIEAAKQKGITDKWNGVCPPIVPTPVHDGDGVRPSDGMPFGPECKGCWVFSATTKADRPVEVVDANLNPIIDQTQIYSGIYARVCVNFFAYYSGGKKGIGCGLGPVQKLSDGDVLGGVTVTAAQAFGMPQMPQPQAYAQPQQPQPQAYVQPQMPVLPGVQINPITGLPM